MNLEAVSISRIYYDGLIDIRAMWSLKDHRECLSQLIFGSPVIYTRSMVPDLDEATKLALKRRLVIVHMPCTPFTE